MYVCATLTVAFYCLDAYNSGSLHYAEMFHFYKLLFVDAIDDDSILQLAAAAVLRGSSDIENPVGVAFKDFDQASVICDLCTFHFNCRVITDLLHRLLLLLLTDLFKWLIFYNHTDLLACYNNALYQQLTF